ncbi:MAG: ABC transporter ATP-binding protein [Planctomycetes bacterium]|nr:ABC transporter ATP-binding protein [Planctomycetota bacterium]
MAEAVIRLDDVTVCHQTTQVLGPLSLTVDRGDFWGVVGPNGAGKTTFLRTIAGLQPIASGSLNVLGCSPRTRGALSALKKRVAFLFQHHDYMQDLPFSVTDVVLFGRVGMPGLGRPFRSQDRSAAVTAMDAMGLDGYAGRLYRELSGGERRKVQLARLLAQEADLLLLDEPTTGLDLDWQERLTCLVEDIHRNAGRTVVMVTHDVDRLPGCCTGVLLLKHGRMLYSGKPAEAFTSGRLSELYDCEMEVAVRGDRYHAFSAGRGGGA